MESEPFVIAIDGVSGAGKSSTARAVAKNLGILHLDTGAMYRAATYLALKNGIQLDQENEFDVLLEKFPIDFSPEGEVRAGGKVLEDKIRSPLVNSNVSDYCQIGLVRKRLVETQRKIGQSRSSVVEGRDIGTVVFPNATFKFFLWASPEIRAKRRFLELQEKGENVQEPEILKNLQERDQKDSSRENSPLKKAVDALEIDTSHLTMSEQIDRITETVRRSLQIPN